MATNKQKELHNLLVSLLGNSNVYYQPPSDTKMNYPAIRYRRIDIFSDKADNKTYLLRNKYEITVISKTPDHPVIEKILQLAGSDYVRPYTSDGLNHDVITLQY